MILASLMFLSPFSKISKNILKKKLKQVGRVCYRQREMPLEVPRKKLVNPGLQRKGTEGVKKALVLEVTTGLAAVWKEPGRE